MSKSTIDTTLPAHEVIAAPVHDGTSADFSRGMKLGMPIFLGYLPVGTAFGILANQYGFSLLAALVCSGTALAGAGQFIALATLAAGGNAVTALIACAVVNLRYVLFSATLSPYVSSIRLGPLSWIAYTLTDESFAINTADMRSGKCSARSMAGVGLIAYIGWLLGTALGWMFGTWIGDPTRFGIDFAMAAMFSALFVALAENTKQVLCGILAGTLVCGLWFASRAGVAIDQNWFIIIASLAAATIALFIFKDDASAPVTSAQDAEIVLTEEEDRG
ncbi:MAG: AzlC family ABC transporter permease [Actinomycetia bacterium]|nr:AzlC family ABC transporter permease [Actinomycetes bacterium]